MQARVDYDAIPKLPGVEEYIKLGAVPGGTERNFASYGHLMGTMTDSQRALLCDPQTSGGLLVSCRPEVAAQVLEIFARHGFGAARVIGTMQTGPAQVQVQ